MRLAAPLVRLAALLLLLGVAAGVSLSLRGPDSRSAVPTLRHSSSERSIEWRHVEDSSLSLLLHTHRRMAQRTMLFPFDADVTVGQVLRSRVPRALVHVRSKAQLACQIVGADDQPLANSAVLADALKKLALPNGDNALSLRCTVGRAGGVSRQHWFGFHSFVEPSLHPNEVRAANLARRAALNEQAEYPMEAAELIGNSWAGIVGWVTSFIKYHWGPLPPYPAYSASNQTGRWHLNTGAMLQQDSTFGDESDSEVRIGIVADWAAGTREADYVQQVMMAGTNGTSSEPYNPHWTLHVGDVYYVGAAEYINANMLGQAPSGVKQGVTWPHGSLGSWAVQGNHEAYSRSWDFFDVLLPTLGVTDPLTKKVSGQASGVVALENKYWRVIMLDSGWNTYNILPKPFPDNKNNTQPPEVIDWLVNEVRIGDKSDTRGLIFMTHHQVQTAFEDPYLATPLQIAELMPPNRTVVWLYGHEHRLSFYKLSSVPNATVPLNVHARCIGNSGFPSQISDLPPRAKESGLIAYDDRVYELQTGFLPVKVGYNGFIHLTLNGPSANLKYSTLTTDENGQLSNRLQSDLVEEVFKSDGAGNVVLSSFAVLNPNVTIVA